MATTSLNRDPSKHDLVPSNLAQSELVQRNLVQVISEEMAFGVKRAVNFWMTEIDLALTDSNLTTLGRLNAVREIVDNYKDLTGEAPPNCRTLPALGTS